MADKGDKLYSLVSVCPTGNNASDRSVGGSGRTPMPDKYEPFGDFISRPAGWMGSGGKATTPYKLRGFSSTSSSFACRGFLVLSIYPVNSPHAGYPVNRSVLMLSTPSTEVSSCCLPRQQKCPHAVYPVNRSVLMLSTPSTEVSLVTSAAALLSHSVDNEMVATRRLMSTFSD